MTQPVDQAAEASHTTGVAFVVAAALSAAVMVAMAKELVDGLPAGIVTFARFFVQAVLLSLLFVVWRPKGDIRPRLSYFIRGALLGVSALALFSSLLFMPLVDAIAISFAEPLILTILGAAFLKESISLRRSVALIIGFIGALIVIRPSFVTVGAPALLPLAAAVCTAICVVITRAQNGKEEPRPMQFWICIAGAVVIGCGLLLGSSGPIEALQFVMPSSNQALGLLAIGALATGVQMLTIAAIQRAPVGILAPFWYFEIIGVTLIGIGYFSEWPDTQTVFGICTIVSAGLYVWFREYRLRNQKQN
ncbi:MAG: DMT family transporter [Pelagimonas sp.]|uniref:DMT family transporter n=1 Tax=Pelagimonas sp. TaxID=2073170 RepID=UPI003D6A6CD1